MKSQRKRIIALAVLGAGIIALVAVYAGDVSLWYAKRQAWERVSNVAPPEKAMLNAVLAAEVKKVPTPISSPEPVSFESGGYRFSLPAAEFRLAGDANDRFDGAKLTVRCDNVAPRTREFKLEYEPSSESVREHFLRSDPFDLIVEAYNTTPAVIRTQRSHEALQKQLYLILYKSIFQPSGSEKHFERFETDRRKGILSGDHTCERIVAIIYLPETRKFAELVIGNKGRAGMADVYHCLGLLKIEKVPPK